MHKRTILFQRNLLYITLLVSALVLLVMLSRWVFGLYDAYTLASREYDQAQTQYQELSGRKERLEQRNQLLHTDTGKRDFLVERRAMVGEGERVLVLVEDNRDSLQEEEERKQKSPPWWQWWRNE